MRRKSSRPIFIVGSPRSGTSILAWCLGQHPNIFPVPESNWMGEFALNIAAAHHIGAARGERSILSAMEIRADEFFAMFGQTINDLVLHHRRNLERKRALEGKLRRRRSKSEPKTRWVDATPEYAYHICGLRKLFPDAVFIHLVRDVDSVVRSMLNFHRVAGASLVASEEEAYKYWLGTVKSCLKAEEAYGESVVYRLLYSSLIDNAETAMQRLLDFVGEPYDAKCLEPLAKRINTSNVPPDFKAEDLGTDATIVEEARRLSATIETTTQPCRGSADVVTELDAAFHESWSKARHLEQDLKDQIRQIQQHYTGEVDGYKSQIASQERHYTAEVEQYKTQIANQERHYTAEVEEYKSQIHRLQQGYKAVTRTLMGMLNRMEKAAARLRESRRWKLVNLGAVVKAKLSHGKGSPGYGDLDDIVAAYANWRASRADVVKTDNSATADPPLVPVTESATSGEQCPEADCTRTAVITDSLSKAEKTCRF
jgi:Sulfotransferase family